LTKEQRNGSSILDEELAMSRLILLALVWAGMLGQVVATPPSLAPWSSWEIATIDWCESNYQFSPFVAEPLNTFSNLSFVLFGLAGAIHELAQKSKRSYVFMHLTIMAIGVGSMLFHGTLTVVGQQLDELPMVWYLLGVFYIVNNDMMYKNANVKAMVSSALLVYALVFSAVHLVLKTTTAFQVHFGLLLLLLLSRVYQRFRGLDIGRDGLKVIQLFVGSGLVAFACWLIDYHGCPYFIEKQIYPFGHLLWHLFMGYSSYCSVVMLHVLESAEKGKPLQIQYHFGLPFGYRSNQQQQGAAAALGGVLASLLLEEGKASHHYSADIF